MALSQEYKNWISPFFEIGLEESSSPLNPNISVAEKFYGLQYSRELKSKHILQGNIARSNFINTTLGIDYQYNVPILFDGLSTFFGAGLALEFVKNSNSVEKTYSLIRPKLGFDYNINNSFLGFFVAYKPKIELDSFKGYDMSIVQAGINFHIK